MKVKVGILLRVWGYLKNEFLLKIERVKKGIKEGKVLGEGKEWLFYIKGIINK